MLCPICDQEVESFHKRSHVLPDWMFKNAYSENHKIMQLDMIQERAQKEQSATHGSFWCNSCESRSSADDTYANLILTENHPQSSEKQKIKRKALLAGDKNSPGVELWTGVDFKKFQKFVFCCILRGELFARIEQREIMAPKHFLAIKEMYQDSGTLDSETYPILVGRSPDDDDKIDWSFLPYRTKFFDHYGILFRGGGFQFQVYTSSHPKPTAVLHGRTNQQGEMTVVVDYFKNTGPYKSSIPRLKNIVKKDPPEKFTNRRKRKN